MALTWFYIMAGTAGNKEGCFSVAVLDEVLCAAERPKIKVTNNNLFMKVLLEKGKHRSTGC